MNSEWKAFLESQAGESAAEQESNPDCALFDLSHLGLIRVTGEDKVDFLQGQFTNDIRQVTEQHSQLSGYCTPKGRLLASFRVFMHGQDIILQMPMETQVPMLKRLPMFVLMSKVEVSDASDQLITIGIAGSCAEDLLAPLFPPLPDEPGDTAHHQGVTLIRLPGEMARFQATGDMAAIQPLWQQLAGKATPATQEYWSLLDIRAGIPNVLEPTIEAFVPQMINMQLLDGVSFTKGCYTGQEVVARMRYLGKLKRRMYLAHVDTPVAPRAGEALFSASSDSSQGAGRIVDARAASQGGYDLLAVVEISSREQDDLHLEDAMGPRLRFEPLPYAFAED